MGRLGIAVVLSASVATSACVQTRQVADLQFTPPQGDFKLLVMRPDVTVNSVTTGGLPEPRADWTDQARANIITAMRAQQAERGGNVQVLERRDQLAGVSAEAVADLERLHGAVGKRLDFLMQELNREANTLASKSVSAEITAIALDLKLAIEQMREQVQNLE